MQRMVIAATVAIALALGVMTQFRRAGPLSPAVELSTPASPLSAQRAAKQRVHPPLETPTPVAESAKNLAAGTNLYARLSNGDR